MKTKSKSILYILPILLVILISGCTSGGTTSGNPGIKGAVIKTFKVTPQEVYLGTSTNVQLEIENIGEEQAQNLEINLVTPDGWTTSSGKRQSVGALVGIEKTPTGETLSGKPYIKTWKLTAPTTQSGLTQQGHEFSVWAYASYTYTTKALKTLPIFSKEEFIRWTQKGEEVPIAYQSGGEGPVTIEIQSAKFERESPTSNRKVRVNLKLTNTGGGTITNDIGGGDTARDYVVRVNNFQILGVSGNCDNGDINLPPGSEGFATCEFIPDKIENIEEKQISAEITYSYRVDSSQKITLRK